MFNFGINLYTALMLPQITVHDVNDNCPVMTPDSGELTPIPVLRQESLLSFSTEDIDSGENGDYRYVISEVTPELVVSLTSDLFDKVVSSLALYIQRLLKIRSFLS